MILSKPDAQFALIHDMTAQDGNRFNIGWLCEIAGVSRSGYYRWLAAKDTRDKRDKDDRRDFEYILAAYRKRGYAKGARGIHMTMLRFTPPVLMNLKKIRRLMNKYDLHCSIRHANPYKKAFAGKSRRKSTGQHGKSRVQKIRSPSSAADRHYLYPETI